MAKQSGDGAPQDEGALMLSKLLLKDCKLLFKAGLHLCKLAVAGCAWLLIIWPSGQSPTSHKPEPNHLPRSLKESHESILGRLRSETQ